MRTIIFLLLALGVMGFIFVMSATPGNESAKLSGIFVKIFTALIPPFDVLTGDKREGALIILSFLVRKAAHFTEFALLGGFISSAFHASRKKKTIGFFLALLIGVLYAISDEFHQSFVPGREMAAFDVCVDSAGVLLGAGLATLFARGERRRGRK
ncbi:MAG: VanZ family protein [Clostridiales Family XIII bacterium]|nr:VanZ family protein [Clostridiales Family XIII bacterium]